MKINSNIFGKGIGVAGILAVALFLAPQAHAATLPSVPDVAVSAPVVAQAPAYCTNVSATAAELSASIASREAKYEAAKDARATSLTTSRAQDDAALAASRAQDDAAYASEYAALEQEATTPAEKAAVALFETNMNAAIATERSSVDAAIAAYRGNVDATVSAREKVIDDAFSALSASITQSITKAENNCANPTITSTTLRSQTLEQITLAREEFVTITTQLNNAATTKTLDGFSDTRDAAVNSAESDFTALTQSAAATIKSAFGAS